MDSGLIFQSVTQLYWLMVQLLILLSTMRLLWYPITIFENMHYSQFYLFKNLKSASVLKRIEIIPKKKILMYIHMYVYQYVRFYLRNIFYDLISFHKTKPKCC